MTDTPTPPLTAAQRLERYLGEPKAYDSALEAAAREILTSWRERGADLEALRARVQELEAERVVARAHSEAMSVELDQARALADELAEGVKGAAKIFRWYEDLHRQKGPEGEDKAARNAEFAERMEAALARHAASKQEGQAGG